VATIEKQKELIKMTDTGIVRLIVNSDKTMVECDNTSFSMYNKHKYLTVSWRPGVDRSIEQNNLWGAMYKRIMQTLGWEFKHARAHCKLYCGIPILKRDCDGFAKSFDAIFGNLGEEACLKLMSPNKLFPTDGFPVTRHFGTRQGVEYTDDIVRHFIDNDVNFADLLESKK